MSTGTLLRESSGHSLRNKFSLSVFKPDPNLTIDSIEKI